MDFQFYGGRSKSTEKRTKVKSRVMASALNELMADASEIYIMGHSCAEMDAVGAEAGLYCIARKHGKRAQMVIDLEHNAAGAVLAKLQALPEYAGAFTSGAEAFLKMRPGALVIVAVSYTHLVPRAPFRVRRRYPGQQPPVRDQLPP